jgi:hypothetical protein
MAVVEGNGIGGWTALDGSPLGGLQQPKSRNADSDLQRGLEVRTVKWSGQNRTADTAILRSERWREPGELRRSEGDDGRWHHCRLDGFGRSWTQGRGSACRVERSANVLRAGLLGRSASGWGGDVFAARLLDRVENLRRCCVLKVVDGLRPAPGRPEGDTPVRGARLAERGVAVLRRGGGVVVLVLRRACEPVSGEVTASAGRLCRLWPAGPRCRPPPCGGVPVGDHGGPWRGRCRCPGEA